MADIKITSENDNETNIRRGLDVIQSMIDISADRLEGLRTHCATSAELTQQEIRILETKLVKMFSELLITKAKLPERFPRGLPPTTGAELKQWLRVVGLSPESLNVVMQRVNTLENLLEKNDTELRTILNSNANIRDEEIRRLVRAMINLKKYRQSIIDCSNNKDIQQIDLYWDSWDRHHHTHYRTGASPRTNRSVITTRYNQQQLYQQQQHLNPIDTTTINNSNNSINDTSADNSILINNSTINILSPEDGSTSTITPSPSPPNSPIVLLQQHQQNNIRQQQQQQQSRSNRGFPTTPPPKKKHQTLITINNINNTTQQQQQQQQQSNIIIDPILLTKSKSHESQLLITTTTTTTTVSDDNTTLTNSMTNDLTSTSTTTTTNTTTATRTRLHTDPTGVDGLEHHQYDSTITGNANHAATLEKLSSSNNLSVPRSPCTPIVTRSMGHMIAHRFTKKFKVISTCDLCQKQMFFGLKCKECKYRCHKDCESNVPPSCGLPQEFVDEFKTHLKLQTDIYLTNTQTSPNMQHRNINVGSGGGGIGIGGAYLLTTNQRQKQQHNIVTYHGQDSSSAGSSCNSSSPSSPALLLTQQQQHQQQQHLIQQQQQHVKQQHQQQQTTLKSTQFHFPEVPLINHNTELICGSGGSVVSSGGITLETHPINDNLNDKSLQSPHPLLSLLSSTNDINQSNDSDKTVSTGSTTSTSNDSERTPPIRLDSTEERDTINWPRQNSLSLKEWDIPYDDLHLLEKIGKGRFGTVHRALWHGDVAVKLLKEDYLDDDCTLEAFKLEVATFKKTRHENVVLFMGACMKPPRLAIVTSLCKGNTLYTHIHLRKDKFNLNRTTLVAQQISQGMGYLHARGIVHKDLKTKNIFLENGKVIITDFGLFSATKLCYCEYGLGIPQGWLCYLAPELICGLKPHPNDDDLPFTKTSDVYAFGTVWYELLCGEFPFKTQSPEAIIWQVGRGMKQTLANLQASRDVKDILMLCWAFQADDRPDFAKLLTLLERLPKKRLARSPSHPVQLSRSAESVF